MTTEILFYIMCAVTVIIMVSYYSRKKKRSAVFGSLTGLAALFLVNRFGSAIGAELPLNLFNICGSSVLGVPFVAILIIIKYL